MMQAFLAAVALVAPTVVSAPPRPMVAQPFPQAPVDPARLAAARQLVRATDVERQLRENTPRLAIAIVAQITRSFGGQIPFGLDQKLESAFKFSVSTAIRAFPPSLVDQIASIYARHFDLGELQRLTVLMQDPAMAKLRAETPAITAETTPVITEAIGPQQEQLQAEMNLVVADWLRDHPEDKAKLVHPPSGQGQPQ